MTSRQRLALALPWLALLLSAASLVVQQLKLGGDLRAFLPRPDATTGATPPRAVATADETRLRVWA